MNLKPEKRVDKNGRLVTRHVRVDSSKPASRLPSPRISAEIEKRHLPLTTKAQLHLYELFDEESQWWPGSAPQLKAVKELKESISALTPQVVATAVSLLTRYPQSRRVRTATRDVIMKAEFYDDIDEMNFDLPFAASEIHWEIAGHQYSYTHFQNRRTATQYVLEIDGNDIWDDKLTPEQLDRAVAASHFMVSAVRSCYEKTGEHVPVSRIMADHEDVLKIFLQHPDKAEELGTLIAERSISTELVNGYLGQYNSLKDGVL